MQLMSLKRVIYIILIVLCVVFAFYGRTVGLFRGLNQGLVFHPDAPKQMVAVQEYLNGRYAFEMRYKGNLFYIGYPYGLNHLDEWLLRMYQPLAEIAQSHFQCVDTSQKAWIRRYPTKIDVHEMQQRFRLYYQGRSLRVLYSMLLLIPVFMLTKRLSGSAVAALWSLAFVAVSPLAMVVTHSATGDIGVDLFMMLSLCALYAWMSRGFRSFWLVAAGMSLGFGFGCKYNALLFGLIPGLLIPMMAWIHKRPLVRDAVKHYSWLALGGLFGFILSTPHVLLYPDKTMASIVDNFTFIKNYNLPAALVGKSPVDFALFGFRHNFVPIMTCLNVFLLLGCLLSTAISLIYVFSSKDTEKRSKSAFFAIIGLTPFIILALTLALKPSVQPFHYSSLVFLLAIGCSALFAFSQRSWVLRGLVLGYFCLVFTVSLLSARNEAYFWASDDTRGLSNAMISSLVAPNDAEKSSVVRDCTAESSELAVFRNRGSVVAVPAGERWTALAVPPVPTTAYPTDSSWIFADGPIFPRNDHLFFVDAGFLAKKRIVFHEKPDELTLGVRATLAPTKVVLRVQDESRELFLRAGESQTAHFSIDACRTTDCASIVDLEVVASPYPVFVDVLTSEKERAAFRVFGSCGEIDDVQTLMEGIDPQQRDAIAQLINQAYYIHSDDVQSIHLRDEYTQLVNDLALQAGRYVFSAVIESEGGATCTLKVVQGVQTTRRIDEMTTVLTNGVQKVSVSFNKSYVPVCCQIDARVSDGKAKILFWELKPDPKALLDDFFNALKDKKLPEWAKWVQKPVISLDEDINFDDLFLLHALTLEKTSKNGTYRVLIDLGVKNYAEGRLASEYNGFIHVEDGSGHQIYAQDISINALFADPDYQTTIEIPAQYVNDSNVHLYFGVYNVLSQERVPPKNIGDAVEVDDERIRVFLP